MNTETLTLIENGLELEIDNTSSYRDFVIKNKISISIDIENKTMMLGNTSLSETQTRLFALFISQLLK